MRPSTYSPARPSGSTNRPAPSGGEQQMLALSRVMMTGSAGA